MSAYVLVKHKVEDYDRWKPVFDEHGAVRKQQGSTGATVYRVQGRPNDLVIISEWPDMEHAQAFAQDPSLPAAMQRGGVSGAPEIYFLEEIERQPA